MSYLSQIIYPKDNESIRKNNECFLIGWNLNNFKCFIVCCVEISNYKNVDNLYNITAKSIENAIVEYKDVIEFCSTSKPVILGKFVPNITDNYQPEHHYQSLGIWITLTNCSLNQFNVKLHSVYSMGSFYYTSCCIVEYKSKQFCDQFYTYNSEVSISLSNSFDSNTTTSTDIVMNQINSTKRFQKLICHYINVLSSQQNNERYYDTKSNKKSNLFNIFINILIYVSYPYFICTTKLINILSIRLFGQWIRDGISVSDISLTLFILSNKLKNINKLSHLNNNFSKSYCKPLEVGSIINRDIFNIIIRNCIDMILSYYLVIILSNYKDILLNNITIISNFILNKFIINILEWFKNNPLDIKLNQVITNNISSMLIYIISNYKLLLIIKLQFIHKYILDIFMYTKCFGITIQISILIDLIYLYNFEVIIMYKILLYSYNKQYHINQSLYYIFFNKKINKLRKRIDTCIYDNNQILFGIFIYAISICLLPTFAIYYYYFTIFYFIIQFIILLLYINIITINHFPYYYIIYMMLGMISFIKIYDKNIGIQYEFIDVNSNSFKDSKTNLNIQTIYKNKKIKENRSKLPIVSTGVSVLKKSTTNTNTKSNKRVVIKENIEINNKNNWNNKINNIKIIENQQINSLEVINNSDSKYVKFEEKNSIFSNNEKVVTIDDIDTNLLDSCNDDNKSISSSNSSNCVDSESSNHNIRTLETRSIERRSLNASNKNLSPSDNFKSQFINKPKNEFIYLKLQLPTISYMKIFEDYFKFIKYFKNQKIVWKFLIGLFNGQYSIDIPFNSFINDFSSKEDNSIDHDNNADFFSYKNKIKESVDDNFDNIGGVYMYGLSYSENFMNIMVTIIILIFYISNLAIILSSLVIFVLRIIPSNFEDIILSLITNAPSFSLHKYYYNSSIFTLEEKVNMSNSLALSSELVSSRSVMAVNGYMNELVNFISVRRNK